MLLVLAAAGAAAIFFLDLRLPPAWPVPVLYTLAVLLVRRSGAPRETVPAAGLASLLILGGAALSAPGAGTAAGIAHRGLALIAVWAAALVRLRGRRSDAAVRHTYRELEDLKFALDQAAIVAITDQKGIITYANDKFCEISKYSREELLGDDHRIVNSGHHPKEFMRDLWRTIAQGRVWRGEIRNRAKDGTLYWVDTTIVPFLNEKGRPYKYLSIRSDITARKQAEDTLRNQEALARIGQMAAVVAHEVKNPLAGISGALQVIRNRLPESQVEKEVVQNVLQRIDDLNDRVRDLLLFARPRPPSFSSVKLAPLLRTTADQLARDPALNGVAVELSGACATLQADPDLLRDAFFNLLLNAAQAMQGDGRIRVSLTAQDGSCRVSVTDDGPGIPEEDRERVFEPFFTTKNRGTGLGLSIARRIVEAHGGEIALAAGYGVGTQVTVCLPLNADVLAAATDPLQDV